MRLTAKMTLILAEALLAVVVSTAQVKLPPETRNAALRYWQAFAELQDLPADQATQDLLEQTAAGEVAWDEARLGAIVDKNRYAILRMQQATRLPECDWGLEYNWRAPVAPLARARALGRLNTLYGSRLAARGDRTGAVDAWLAGIRFSQHIARADLLVFAVVGQSILLSNLRAVTQAVEAGGLSEMDRRKIETIIHPLPESGFDWSSAMRTEEATLIGVVDEISQSTRPGEFYEAAMGEPAPQNFSIPSISDRAAYHRLMAAAAEALSQPPAVAQIRLRELDRELRSGRIHWFFQRTTPSFLRVNERRAAIASARDRLLQALASGK
jgi:hypothetical protein